MKRIYLIFLTLCVSATLFAQLSIWNGSSDIWTKGAGTEASPFLIESAEQLAFISDMVNGGVTTYENTYFKLMTNIDLNNLEWVPIGNIEGRAFKGNLNGNNNTIINSSNYLFGVLDGAYVTKLNLQMKGMADIVINGYFKNCTTICTNNGTFCNKAQKSNFVFCRSFVDIYEKVEKSDIKIEKGALINIADSCNVFNSVVNGIMCIYYTGNLSCVRNGNIYMGGIIGASQQSNIFSCCNLVNITVEVESEGGAYGNEDASCYKGGVVGGIIGYSSTDNIIYSNSIGTIKGINSSCESKSYTYTVDSCGIVGLIDNIADSSNQNKELMGTLQNCYTSSPLIYNIACARYNYTEYVRVQGGIQQVTREGVRISDETSVFNSYSSTDKTEASMKSASFPIILNTDSTVFIQDKYGVNDGYPIYKEQVYAITTPATDVQLTSAILNANYYALNADSVGFEYKQTNDKTHWYTRITIDSSSAETSYKLEGLETGTEYTYRFWVAQNGVIYFGDTQTFTTQECNTDTFPIEATICKGEEFEFANQILKETGIYYDTLTAVNGCDSIIALTLNVSPINEIQKYDTISVGDSYDFFGQILTESGVYKHYVPAGSYCNLVIMNLHVKQPFIEVTAISIDDNMGIIKGSGSYEKYSTITLTAIPNEGYIFTTWSDGDTNPNKTMTVTGDISLIAYFETIKYTISAVSNNEELGVVYGGGEYDFNTSVSLMAIPNNGVEFITWTNGVTDNPYIFNVVQDLSIQAIFKTILSGVDDVKVDKDVATKIIKNGQLLIIRDDKVYNVIGQEVKE